MVTSASESPAASPRASGEGGFSRRGGIHAVIRRLCDAPDSRPQNSTSSNGVSTRIRVPGQAFLHKTSESARVAGQEPFQESEFKPGIQSKASPSGHEAHPQPSALPSCPPPSATDVCPAAHSISISKQAASTPHVTETVEQADMATNAVDPSADQFLQGVLTQSTTFSTNAVSTTNRGAVSQTAIPGGQPATTGCLRSRSILAMPKLALDPGAVLTAAVPTERAFQRQVEQTPAEAHEQHRTSTGKPCEDYSGGNVRLAPPTVLLASTATVIAASNPPAAQRQLLQDEAAHALPMLRPERRFSGPWSTAAEGSSEQPGDGMAGNWGSATPQANVPVSSVPDESCTPAEVTPQLTGAMAQLAVVHSQHYTSAKAAATLADPTGHRTPEQAGSCVAGASFSQNRTASSSLHDRSTGSRSIDGTSACQHANSMLASVTTFSPATQCDQGLPSSFVEPKMPLQGGPAHTVEGGALAKPSSHSPDCKPLAAFTWCSQTVHSSQTVCYGQDGVQSRSEPGCFSGGHDVQPAHSHMRAHEDVEAHISAAVAESHPQGLAEAGSRGTAAANQVQPSGDALLEPEQMLCDVQGRSRWATIAGAETSQSSTAQHDHATAPDTDSAFDDSVSCYGTAAEAGDMLAASAGNGASTGHGLQTSDAPNIANGGGQPSFFDRAGFSPDRGSGSTWARASRPDLRDTQAVLHQGIAEGGFGSGTNTPALQHDAGTGAPYYSLWGSDAAQAATALGDDSPSVQDGGPGALSLPKPAVASSEPRSFDAVAEGAQHQSAVHSADDQHDARAPSAADATWGGAWPGRDPDDPGVAAAAGSFFDEMGWSEAPGHAQYAADGGNGAGGPPGPGVLSQGGQQADAAPEPATETPGWPDEGAAGAEQDWSGIAQAQGDEGEAYWWDDWGCWVSACGQYYYNEATGMWPGIYGTEASPGVVQGQEEWGSQLVCDVGNAPIAGTLAAGLVGDKASEMTMQADAEDGLGGGSFFDSFAPNDRSSVAEDMPHVPIPDGQDVSQLGARMEPAAGAGVSGMHANSTSVGQATAGRAFDEVCEAPVWSGSLPYRGSEYGDTGHVRPGGVAAASTHGRGGYFDSAGSKFFDDEAEPVIGEHSAQQPVRGAVAAWGAEGGAMRPQVPSLSQAAPVPAPAAQQHGQGPVRPGTHGHAYPSLQAGQHAAQTTGGRTQLQPCQQHLPEHAAAPQCSDPPRSATQGMHSNVGRPPRSMAVFGFGGRCCLFRLPPAAPGYSETYTPSSPYMVSIMACRALPQFLVGGASAPVHPVTAGGKRQNKSQPVSPAVAELQDWPGPMAQTAPAPKALAAAVEKRAAVAAGSGQDALALLWRLLLVMAKHKGAVQDSMCKQGSPEGAILALIKQALEGSDDAQDACSMDSQRLREWAAYLPDAAAFSKIEMLLMEGDRSAALTAASEARARSAILNNMLCTAWPIALAIAQFSGPEALHSTLRQLLDAALLPGSATHIFSLLATQSFDGVAASIQQASTTPANAGRFQTTAAATTVSSYPGVAKANNAPGADVPGAQVQPHMPAGMPAHGSHLHAQPLQSDGSTFCFNWRKSLLMLAANRSAGDMPALAALGDELWAAKSPQVLLYAHVCYILAGKLLGTAADPGCTFVVPGADHIAAMGACAHTDSLQRIELLAWCHMQCHGVPMYCAIPSYIMYAGRLAEEGLIADALAYAAAAVCLATKAKADRQLPVQPVGIDLLASFAQDFHERLKAHSAAVGASNTRSGQSVASRVGSFLDRSVMRMLGTDSQSPSPAEMSKSASAASLTSAAPVRLHQSGGGHGRHPSFDSESQNVAANLHVPSQGKQAPQPAKPLAGVVPPSPPQPTPLLNTMHASQVYQGPGAGEGPTAAYGPAEHPIQGAVGPWAGQGQAANQRQQPAPSSQQHSQPSWLPPSLPAQSSSLPSTHPEPSKGWFGGIAAKLLPRGNSGTPNAGAGSCQEQSAGQGGHAPLAPLVRPPLYPRNTQFQQDRPQQGPQQGPQQYQFNHPASQGPQQHPFNGSAVHSGTHHRPGLPGAPGPHAPHVGVPYVGLPQPQWQGQLPSTANMQYLQ